MSNEPPLSCRPTEEVLQAINEIGEATQLSNSYIVSQMLIWGVIAYQKGDLKIPYSKRKMHRRGNNKAAMDRRRARELNHGVEAAPLPEDQTALRNDR